jgi:hypothetical protein
VQQIALALREDARHVFTAGVVRAVTDIAAVHFGNRACGFHALGTGRIRGLQRVGVGHHNHALGCYRAQFNFLYLPATPSVKIEFEVLLTADERR